MSLLELLYFVRTVSAAVRDAPTTRAKDLALEEALGR
jgi:hypothetical protein